jgi:hypothetical protein
VSARRFIALAVAFALAACTTAAPVARHEAAAPQPSASAPACSGSSRAMARTELYFGLSHRTGVISEREFQAFVDAQITPRFPAGLTLLSGVGQFRDAGGILRVEGAKLLIVLHPSPDAQADASLEAIRDAYVRRFAQQSVLRVDGVACVSF